MSTQPEPGVTPNIPEFVPDPTPSPLSPDVENVPPLAGTSSPFVRVDGQSRDIIIEAIRTWLRTVLWAWTKKWQASLVKFIADVTKWLNSVVRGIWEWLEAEFKAQWDYLKEQTAAMWKYIDEHTLKSWRSTTKTSDPGTDASVTITGTLTDPILNFTIPRGLTGYGWWLTSTAITTAATEQTVTVPSVPKKPVQLGDFVVTRESSTYGNFGEVTALVDETTVKVTFAATLRGPKGADGITKKGSVATNITLNAGEVRSVALTTPTQVGAYFITTNSPVWVRVYASKAYADADITRDINTPLPLELDTGCYLDFVSFSDGGLDKTFTPNITYTALGDGPLYITVQNLLGVSQPVRIRQDYYEYKS